MWLSFVVFGNFAEFTLQVAKNLLDCNKVGDAADENLGVGERSLNADRFLIDCEVLEGADLLHLRGWHLQKGLILVLLPPQNNLLGSQLGLRKCVDDQRFHLQLWQQRYIVQNDRLSFLTGFHQL